MTDYPVTPDEWQALTAEADTPGGLGEMFEIECNVDPETDFLQARRVGKAGAPTSRAAVYVHHSDDMYATVYIAAAEARQLAAHLLNVADEIDGKTPLVFFPRAAGETAAEDVTATEVVEDGWKSIIVGQRVRVTGNDSGACHHFFEIGEQGQVLQVQTEDTSAYLLVRSDSNHNLAQWVHLADLESID